MKSKYYNEWEFNQALSLHETNPFEAKNKYEEYLKKYPKDYSIYPYYASILIALGNFKSAEKILDYVEQISNKDDRFIKDNNKVNRLKNNILSNRIKLLSYQEKYNELYYFCITHEQELKNIGLKPTIFYSMKMNGKLISDIRDGNSYLFRQIIDYKEEDLLQNIQIHLADYNKDKENRNQNIFSPNFPVEEIIEEIKKYIPSDKRLFFRYFEDQYIFKYNNCGKENNKTVDYIKVICFHNTSNIITMYPAANCQDLPYIDINYLIKETKNPKVRRLTQIEKFNQRYSHK